MLLACKKSLLKSTILKCDESYCEDRLFKSINGKKTIRSHSGFSLLELVAVLIITSVLAITVIPRFSINNDDLLVAKKSVLDALRHSRGIALARAQTNSSIRFIASASTIDIREDGASVKFLDVDYPLSLPTGITIRGAPILLTFDTLGGSTSSLIEITDGNVLERVTLTGGGYAY